MENNLPPLVSILIPVYNREHLVGETIESAINQTYKNIEIIIVDNCSTDNTWNVLQEYAKKDARIRLFQNKENIGPVRNWKRCIDEAKGEYAKILFSDDLISENFVEETIKLFDNDTAFVISPINVIGNNKDICLSKYNHIDIVTSTKYLNDILLYGVYRFPVSPGSAIFRSFDLKNSLVIDLPNNLNLDFSIYGAGNDLLIYLNTIIRYKYLKIAKNATSFFRFHKDSFTIANKLEDYYYYSKLYFILKNRSDLKSNFKSLLWYRKKDKSKYYSLLNTNRSLKFMMLFILKKLIFKYK